MKKDGSVAVIFTFVLSLLVLSGLAVVDYSIASDTRQRLQLAADTAVTAITQNQLLGSATDRRIAAEAMLDANLRDELDYVVEEIVVDEDGFARIRLSSQVDTFAWRLAGMSTIDVSVLAEAGFVDPPPIEFTFAIDNSPSMLIGATQSDIDRMEVEYSCAFACHWTAGNNNATYDDAKDLGVAFRLDAASDSVGRAAQMAAESTFAQYADIWFDLYMFSRWVDPLGRAKAGPSVTAKLNAVEPAPRTTPNIYEMTDPTRTLDSIATRVAEKVEESSDAEHFVVVITDGVTNYRSGGRIIRAFSADDCQDLKASGATVAVIYTTYHDLPSNGTWKKYVAPISDGIAPGLAACADPGWFFEAEFADDIDDAIETILDNAIPNPLITK